MTTIKPCCKKCLSNPEGGFTRGDGTRMCGRACDCHWATATPESKLEVCRACLTTCPRFAQNVCACKCHVPESVHKAMPSGDGMYVLAWDARCKDCAVGNKHTAKELYFDEIPQVVPAPESMCDCTEAILNGGMCVHKAVREVAKIAFSPESVPAQDWEKAFDDNLWRFFTGGVFTDYLKPQALKDFIRQQIAQAREEGYQDGQKHAFEVDRKAVLEEGHRMTKKEILKIIDQRLELEKDPNVAGCLYQIYSIITSKQ